MCDFENRCLQNYVLFYVHDLSAPALSSNAMLSMTKVELDHVGMNFSFWKKV